MQLGMPYPVDPVLPATTGQPSILSLLAYSNIHARPGNINLNEIDLILVGCQLMLQVKNELSQVG